MDGKCGGAGKGKDKSCFLSFRSGKEEKAALIPQSFFTAKSAYFPSTGRIHGYLAGKKHFSGIIMPHGIRRFNGPAIFYNLLHLIKPERKIILIKLAL